MALMTLNQLRHRAPLFLFVPVQEFYVTEFRCFHQLQTNKTIFIVRQFVLRFNGNLP